MEFTATPLFTPEQRGETNDFEKLKELAERLKDL